MTEVYDLAAIGAGPAGDSAQEPPPFYGHRSVVIETNRPGGTLTTTRSAPTIMLCPGACDSETIPAPKDILRTAPRILEIVLSPARNSIATEQSRAPACHELKMGLMHPTTSVRDQVVQAYES